MDFSEGERELPPGWAWARLGDLIKGIEAGKNVSALGRPPGAGETGIVKVSAVTWGEFDESESKTLPAETQIDERHLIRAGDFLISRANTLELVGAPVIVKTCTRRLVLSDKVLRLQLADGVDRWVELFLKSGAGRAEIERYAQGAQLSMRNIAQDNLRRIQLPLAPHPEQARIVAAVNALFEEVEAGEAALTRARAGLETFRASLLHAACTGALTAPWRQANPTNETGAQLLETMLRERRARWEDAYRAAAAARNKPLSDASWKARYPLPVQPNPTDLPDLPPNWTWATVDQLSFVSGGITKNAARQTIQRQYPYLRVANVGEDRIDLSDLRMIGAGDAELERVLLRKDDLLFVEGNGSPDQIGRVAVWDAPIDPCIHQNHLIKARPVRASLGRWMLLWFMAPVGKQVIQAAASSTSGLHTLSISKIEVLPVPLPPAREIDAILAAVADAEAETGWEQPNSLGALRQSILHAAFTGRLVPQDPSDEPASALLARLRGSAAASPRRGRRTRAQQPCLIGT
jgi:type I restriction enzyme S subunit